MSPEQKIDLLIRRSANELEVSYEDLLSKTNRKKINRARKITWKTLVKLGFSYVAIAKAFDRDPSSIRQNVIRHQSGIPWNKSR